MVKVDQFENPENEFKVGHPGTVMGQNPTMGRGGGRLPGNLIFHFLLKPFHGIKNKKKSGAKHSHILMMLECGSIQLNISKKQECPN